ncbi:MAG: hypothetical protein ACYS0F_12400, partial [Planctomycetota bacterium]
RGKVPFTIRVNGRGAWTMGSQPDPDSMVYSVWDTFSGNVNGVLYELYIAFPEIINKQSRVILGRQFIDEGVYLQFDGGRFDLALKDLAPDLVVSVYGGAGVEWGMPDGEEHWLVGVLGKGTIPKWKTRWRLQYLFVNQYFEGINDPAVGPIVDPVSYPAQTLEDHLVGATIWQPFGDQTRFLGRFTLLNGDANELHLRLRWFTKDGQWTVLAEWYQLFQRLFNVTNDLTPYVPMLGSFDPFFRATVKSGGRVRRRLARARERRGRKHLQSPVVQLLLHVHLARSLERADGPDADRERVRDRRQHAARDHQQPGHPAAGEVAALARPRLRAL